MGHGDELVLADAHFPGDAMNSNVLRADGLLVPELLDAILPLYELYAYVDDPVIMMSPVRGDSMDPALTDSYSRAIANHAPKMADINYIDRFDFYEVAKRAFAVVMTGETRKYGNIIL